MALFDIISVFFVVIPVLAAVIAGQFGRSSLGIASGTVLSVGIAGTFIGNVQMLSQMDNPAHLLPALSVSLLTALYAAMVKFALDVVQSNKPAPAPLNPGPVIGAAAAALCLACFVAAIVLGSPLLIFFDVRAAGFFVLGAVLIGLLGVSSGSRCIEGDLARFLPQVGLLILYASIVAVMPVLDDPSSIGPVLAWGLLGHFYCTVSSLLIKLGVPHRVPERSSQADWRWFAASLFGLSLHMALLVRSIS